MKDNKTAPADTTIADRLEELVRDHDQMKEAMAAVGEDSLPPNGLIDLARRVEQAPVLIADAEVTVTASASVDRYDAVALTKELARQGEELSIAAEGAKLLSVCTMQSSGKNPGNSEAAVVFAQDGKTKIKAIQWDGTEWIFGGTQELLETELEAVTVTALNGYLVVLFRESEFGMVKFYSMYGTELTLLATDLWTDDSPYNITAAWVPERTCRVTQTGMGSNDWYDRGQVVVSWLNDQGALKLEALSLESTWNEAEGEPNYSVKSIHTATVAAGEYEGIHYTVAVQKKDYTGYEVVQRKQAKAFAIPTWDTEEYLAQGAWCMGSNSRTGDGWLVFPGADGKRYLLSFVSVTDENFTHDEQTGQPRVMELAPIGCSELILQGSVGTGGIVGGVRMSGWLGASGPYVVTGLARGGGNGRRIVAIENWCSGYWLDHANMWFGEENVGTGNLGLVSTALCGESRDQFAIGFAKGDQYCAMVCYARGGSLCMGPVVQLGRVSVAARLTEIGAGPALIRETEAGIFLQKYKLCEVAERVAGSELADAQAITSGGPGQKIKVKRMK